ncbi:ATP-binding cassette domain-containing protein [Serratia ureilytica]
MGSEVAMIFQDPMTSLNPCYTVGYQIMEALKVHQGRQPPHSPPARYRPADPVGIPDPASRLDVYPHQLSGGMSQRVMIAMAIACRPKLLIADEPTTALDVTIQAQIIELLLDLQQRENMALLLITHDLALVAEAAHHIIVMYAGQVVESGKAAEIFRAPRHPYTQALLRALPEFAADKARLASLPGVVPGNTIARPAACSTRVVPTPTSAAATRSRNCAAFPAVRLNVTHRWMMRGGRPYEPESTFTAGD